MDSFFMDSNNVFIYLLSDSKKVITFFVRLK